MSIGQANPKLYDGKVSAREGDTVPLIRDERNIRILVAGGPGAFVAHAIGGGPTPGHAEIQEIKLPSNWDTLVKKYGDIAPNYVRY
ncbi:MAG: hypothetical protein MUO19_01705 [Dehalococcoidales bacterium]|nr:hypothetical protein [Dehalococcoidales bacterium]